MIDFFMTGEFNDDSAPLVIGRVTDSSLIGSWMETVRLGKTERAKLRPGPRREREGEGESALSIGRGPNNNMAAKEKRGTHRASGIEKEESGALLRVGAAWGR